MMQAFAEGFDIMRHRASEKLPADERYDLNLADVAEVWRRGSVVTSWLLDLTASALAKNRAARRLLRPCRGQRRRPLDDRGRHRGSCAGRRAGRLAVRALPLAPAAHLRREGAVGHATGFRRSCRGTEEITEEDAMRVGAFYFPTDYGINIAELARALEDRGFDSLFVPEHTHIPTSRKSPFPGGGELPKRYSHTHDPFVALTFAAAATKKLKLGTGILLVPQHEPIVTAKAHRLPRPAVGRPLRLRHRRRLERRGDGEPRRALQDALQADARARAGDEGAVDQGRGRVSRRVREVRPGLVVAEAGAAAASADHPGRRDRLHAAPRRRILRRLVPAPARAASMPPASIAPPAPDGREEGPRSRRRSSSPCSARPPTPRRSTGYDEAGIDSALLEIPDESRDEILRYLDKIAPLAKVALAA